MTSQSRYTARTAQMYSPNKKLCETCARDEAKCRGNVQLLFFGRVEIKDMMTAEVSRRPRVRKPSREEFFYHLGVFLSQKVFLTRFFSSIRAR